MNKIFNLGSVDQYNKLYGLETLNPLVSVINLNKATRQMNYAHWHYGIYALSDMGGKIMIIKKEPLYVLLPDRMRKRH